MLKSAEKKLRYKIKVMRFFWSLDRILRIKMQTLKLILFQRNCKSNEIYYFIKFLINLLKIY